jgi:D-alanyl-lipoteichoic acid acyltransferase DltB (MBOAT superfamily)
MLFNSLHFAIFFPLVTLIYFLVPFRYRWAWMLAASCYFYMAFVPIYIVILGVTILVDYAAGLQIEKSQGAKRRHWLWASIVVTCAVLFIFKYYGFYVSNVNALAEFLGWNYSIKALEILLPIGLSFHTFQSLSYVIEVYRGEQKAEPHFGIYSLYVMYYPQLVAGPIERPQNILHQLHEEKPFNFENLSVGLKFMMMGLFKKVVIADNLAPFVNRIYNSPGEANQLEAILATVLFAFQIFYDFSGYSDMARGASKVMGIDLMINFNHPYFAKSVSDFWSRWHISLSTWFRDYVYIPLGGSRVSALKNARNLLVTFLLSGLWHGANWTYVIWGGLNGAFLILEKYLGLAKLPKPLRWLITFTLICFTWIFFRANSLSDAWLVVHKIFVPGSGFNLTSSLQKTLGTLVGLGIFILFAEFGVEKGLGSRQRVTRWATAWFVCMLIIFASADHAEQFIYFQF